MSRARRAPRYGLRWWLATAAGTLAISGLFLALMLAVTERRVVLAVALGIVLAGFGYAVTAPDRIDYRPAGRHRPAPAQHVRRRARRRQRDDVAV